jgi:hypothetical protein
MKQASSLCSLRDLFTIATALGLYKFPCLWENKAINLCQKKSSLLSKLNRESTEFKVKPHKL